MNNINKRRIYNTILSQTISTDGRYLFAGNNFGEIFVYSLEKISSNVQTPMLEYDVKSSDPIQVYKASNTSQIYSLAFFKDNLIVGTNGVIFGLSWATGNNKNLLSTVKWTINLSNCHEFNEVNYLLLDTENCNLYAGCGDSSIYCISLEDGKIVRHYDKAHKDYIHCVAGCGDKIASASEDGSVKIWDTRQAKCIHILEPYKNNALCRPEHGNWQGTVSITNDWLVCGGGPKLALYHLRTLDCTTSYSFPGKLHVSTLLDNVVIAGGDHKYLHRYDLNGDVTAEIELSSSSALSLVLQTEPFKIMSIGGTSNKLDICSSFNYRDMVLKCL